MAKYKTKIEYFHFIPFYLILFLFSSIYAENKIIHHYKVSISKDLQTLFVEANFGNISFYHLYAGSSSGTDHIKNMRMISGRKTFTYSPESYELALGKNGRNSKMLYQFDISSSIGTGRRASVQKIGDDVILPPDLWLWRPYELEENEQIIIEFDFPANINFSVPWQKTAHNKFLVDRSPYDWPAVAAFGTFNIDTVEVPGCKLAVAFLDGNYSTSKPELLHWIKNAATSVTKVYGEFPVKNAQVLIIPGGKRREPVPFGMVVRGGGLSIQFNIDPSRPVEEFIADWTATHELSHSLLPYIKRKEMWLSEGLATYYQYVLMGRDGRLSERQAWQRIYNGFQKGKRNSSGKSVKQTAENMGRYHAYPFVYWTGAAMMLKADVALRKESYGQNSLDIVLKKIRNRLIPATRTWGGREMLKEMDLVGKTTVFMKLYNKHIYADEFPVDESYWEKLGILIEDGEVRLTNNAPLVHIRKQIIPPE
ncbi:MAG: hypothetical protein D8M58_10945 [Calditrichaeota bacterium]|nr:MAG: hypothetical protein DWQ03_10320 [Calditrichota bacterium]MBL1205909.1 hypothetical protein [Calditrichota bacterium]NOG45737.1 hypothetical protein [Calditrichota bacterium]